jgi:hypothetical protein
VPRDAMSTLQVEVRDREIVERLVNQVHDGAVGEPRSSRWREPAGPTADEPALRRRGEPVGTDRGGSHFAGATGSTRDRTASTHSGR